MNGQMGQAERAERARHMIEMRLRGCSLREIGAEFGVSHELVRQVIQNAGGPSTGNVRRLKAGRAQAERADTERRIRDYLADGHLRTVQDVADALGVSPRAVREALGPDARRLLGAAPRHFARAADEELLEQLYVVGDLVDGPLTGKKYDEVARELSLFSRVLLVQRFGSWTRACELAGVEAGKARRANYRQRWTRAQMVRWVARYLSLPHARGSYDDYDEFARCVDGAPSSQTVRNEFGTWRDAKAEALACLAHNGLLEGVA